MQDFDEQISRKGFSQFFAQRSHVVYSSFWPHFVGSSDSVVSSAAMKILSGATERVITLISVSLEIFENASVSRRIVNHLSTLIF